MTSRTRHVALVAAALASTLPTVALERPASAYPVPGRVDLVTVPDGSPRFVENQAGEATGGPSLSANARFVAFHSSLPDLVANDGNPGIDVFVRDRRAGETELISVSPVGLPALGASWNADIGPTGRYVVFGSDASNLVPGDTNLDFDVFLHDRSSGHTERVSVDSSENQADLPVLDHRSDQASVSRSGRYVVFSSEASDLVENDGNDAPDVFLRDLVKGVTERISVPSKTEEANGASACPSISADGRYVAFMSGASNLVDLDLNQATDVFVSDIAKRSIERVSVDSHGRESLATLPNSFTTCSGDSISRTGRFVTFVSRGQDLVPNDTGAIADWDVFRHDRKKKETELVSLTSSGEEVNESSHGEAVISGNGRFVAFDSPANSLVDGDTGTSGLVGDGDVFVHDMFTGATNMASVTDEGVEAGSCADAITSLGGGTAIHPELSGNGRYVSFVSCSNSLVDDDPHDGPLYWWDVFVRDGGDPLGVGGAARVAPFHSARIIELHDRAGAATPTSLGGDIVSARLAARPELGDVYARIDVDRIPSARTGVGGASTVGDPALVYGFELTVDGSRYEVRIARTGSAGDALHPVFGLFRCDPGCREVSELQGGYGTSGDSLVVSIPLKTLGTTRWSDVQRVRGFSRMGTYSRETSAYIDRTEQTRP